MTQKKRDQEFMKPTKAKKSEAKETHSLTGRKCSTVILGLRFADRCIISDISKMTHHELFDAFELLVHFQ